MFALAAGTTPGATVWLGHLDAQAAHDTFLAWLKGEVGATFLPPPLPADPLDVRTKGNLGESIAAHIGLKNHHAGHRCDAPNAWTPMSGVSRADLDVVWVALAADPKDDLLWIQEVKTSGDPNLAVAAGLTSDYGKLFGTNVRVTLAARISAIAARLEYGAGRPDHAKRVRALGALSPATASSVHLEPTLVTDSAYETTASSKVSIIRSGLIAQGWDSSRVDTHVVLLDDLEDRLKRIAFGLP